jgi:alpha-beta hydrolase superfamily lysophospholipase
MLKLRAKLAISSVIAVIFFAVLISTSSCSPKVQKFKAREQDPQIISENSASYIIAGDGVRLPLRKWQSTNNPKAVLLGVHGFNDYSKSFAMPGEYFSEFEISVYAYDQRGFGSHNIAAKNPGVWGGEQNFTHDLEDALAALRVRYPHTPIFIVGESMGGAVTILSALDNKLEHADGIILSAPAVWGGKSMPWIYRATSYTTAHLFPSARLSGKGVVKVQASDNLEMLKELGKDPLIIKSSRADTLYGIVQLMDKTANKATHFKNFEKPTLILAGEKDEIIKPKATKAFLDTLDNSHDTIFYEDGWHLLMRDLARKKVYEDILKWVDQRV